jgi:DMSO/TMAO reductase YedYZ molybdopterin-dependent catalytic subunit
MSDNAGLTRRNILKGLFAGGCAAVLGGCQKLSESGWFERLLGLGERATKGVHRLIIPRRAMAQEFGEADPSLEFRSNGTALPADPRYQAMAENGFAEYRLEVCGLVEGPAAFSLAEIRLLPSREQITRHDCVEGWSAIGRWKGARLSALLEVVRPKPDARYVVFHCADRLGKNGVNPYYESIDMEDAFHPQTILAYELNGETLPIKNGAPLRLRVERQLGYKMAKYVMRIELVKDLSAIGGGKGGYWEDRGYEWYAGI